MQSSSGSRRGPRAPVLWPAPATALLPHPCSHARAPSSAPGLQFTGHSEGRLRPRLHPPCPQLHAPLRREPSRGPAPTAALWELPHPCPPASPEPLCPLVPTQAAPSCQQTQPLAPAPLSPPLTGNSSLPLVRHRPSAATTCCCQRYSGHGATPTRSHRVCGHFHTTAPAQTPRPLQPLPEAARELLYQGLPHTPERQPHSPDLWVCPPTDPQDRDLHEDTEGEASPPCVGHRAPLAPTPRASQAKGM